MNTKLAAEKDLRANCWADRVEYCFERDAELSQDYNLNIAGGKWNHMMDQTHIGYRSWDEPRGGNIMPKAPCAKPEEAKQSGYIFSEKNKPKNKGRDSKLIEEKQKALAQRIDSLLSLAERGVKMEEVTSRLQKLGREKTELEYARRSCEAIEEREVYDQGIAKKVAEFFSDFESHFEQAPMSERKALVHQVVERIVIDQKTRVAECYLLKIPKQEMSQLNEKRGVVKKTPLYNVSPTKAEDKEQTISPLLDVSEYPV